MAKQCQGKGKKQKPLTVGKANERAWQAFSQFCKLRDAIKTTGTLTKCICVTCGKTYPMSQIQGGHGIQGRAKNILFDEELVNGQCKRCNIFLGGMYSRYAVVLTTRHGEEWFAEKERISRLPAEKPWRVPDLLEIEEKYKAKIAELVK